MILSDNTKVIIKRPFQGNAQTFVSIEGKVHYSDLTVDEYLAQNPGCEVVTWEEYDALIAEMFTSPLQPTTLEYFLEKMEELPPLRHKVIGGCYEVFFNAEATSGIYHGFNVWDRAADKYYAGTKSIGLTDAQLLEIIKAEISN